MNPTQKFEFENEPGEISGEDIGLCPCGAKIWADVEHCAVIHSIPPCKAYLELDPNEFLRYVRSARGISDQ